MFHIRIERVVTTQTIDIDDKNEERIPDPVSIFTTATAAGKCPGENVAYQPQPKTFVAAKWIQCALRWAVKLCCIRRRYPVGIHNVARWNRLLAIEHPSHFAFGDCAR